MGLGCPWAQTMHGVRVPRDQGALALGWQFRDCGVEGLWGNRTVVLGWPWGHETRLSRGMSRGVPGTRGHGARLSFVLWPADANPAQPGQC